MSDSPREAAAPTPVRRTVRYSGTVQGVNFRRSTARVAEGYSVLGYVRNEPDGTVRLVVEGRPGVLSRFLTDVGEVMDGYIAEAAVEETLATGEFSRFEIRTRR